jgi:hypothetical protein
LSTSASDALLSIADASTPADEVSSFTLVSEYVWPLVIVGASLTLVTTIWAEASLLEKAVVPPELAVVA